MHVLILTIQTTNRRLLVTSVGTWVHIEIHLSTIHLPDINLI